MTIQIGITDVETNESVVREATDSEVAELKATQEEMLANRATREQNKIARQSLLAKLGITEDEARLLLGGN
jgi:hypothetical protein